MHRPSSDDRGEEEDLKLLITGGSGFIGSAVARMAIDRGLSVVNVDKMTYAATLGSTSSIEDSNRYTHEAVDIVDTAAVADVLDRHRPDLVMHLAAESHVDRSIDRPSKFVMTNVVGTTSLLSAATEYFHTLDDDRRDRFRFHHVSTDEVFGSLGPEGKFSAASPYDPRSPYAASKASSDHFARAWFHTFELPVVLSNCSNNYGPFQFPEKLIPLLTIRALMGRSLPLYGSGENVRDWLFVEDHADALLNIVSNGIPGTTYLVGGDAERSNVAVAREVCTILDRLKPTPDGSPHIDRLRFVADRPGHDFRYAIDSTETTASLGWRPRIAFSEGLERTVRWYLANEVWWRPLAENGEIVDRVGLGRSAEASE